MYFHKNLFFETSGLWRSESAKRMDVAELSLHSFFWEQHNSHHFPNEWVPSAHFCPWWIFSIILPDVLYVLCFFHFLTFALFSLGTGLMWAWEDNRQKVLEFLSHLCNGNSSKTREMTLKMQICISQLKFIVDSDALRGCQQNLAVEILRVSLMRLHQSPGDIPLPTYLRAAASGLFHKKELILLGILIT